MSPWDLEPIDERRKPSVVAEIASTLYRPRPEDWGGDRDAELERDSECKRISAGLSQVMSLFESGHFTALADLNLYPFYALVVEYPIDISTIIKRLNNRFYRRESAVQFDANYIFTNASKFCQPNSNDFRSASIITDLCQEIIRNRDAVDVKAIYQELEASCKFRDEEADGVGEQSREGPSSTPNTRYTWQDLYNESEEDSFCNGEGTSIPKVN